MPPYFNVLFQFFFLFASQATKILGARFLLQITICIDINAKLNAFSSLLWQYEGDFIKKFRKKFNGRNIRLFIFKADSLRFLTPANRDGFYMLKIAQVLFLHQSVQFIIRYSSKNPHFAMSKIYVLKCFLKSFLNFYTKYHVE